MGTNDNKVIGGLDQVSGYTAAARLATGTSWRSAASCRSAAESVNLIEAPSRGFY